MKPLHLTAALLVVSNFTFAGAHLPQVLTPSYNGSTEILRGSVGNRYSSSYIAIESSSLEGSRISFSYGSNMSECMGNFENDRLMVVVERGALVEIKATFVYNEWIFDRYECQLNSVERGSDIGIWPETNVSSGATGLTLYSNGRVQTRLSSIRHSDSSVEFLRLRRTPTSYVLNFMDHQGNAYECSTSYSLDLTLLDRLGRDDNLQFDFQNGGGCYDFEITY